MAIQESGQDYLEAILIIRNRKGSVRSVDIAGELGFSKASVSAAMKTLKAGGYIEMDAHKAILLTPKGEALAPVSYTHLASRSFSPICPGRMPAPFWPGRLFTYACFSLAGGIFCGGPLCKNKELPRLSLPARAKNCGNCIKEVFL